MMQVNIRFRTCLMSKRRTARAYAAGPVRGPRVLVVLRTIGSVTLLMRKVAQRDVEEETARKWTAKGEPVSVVEGWKM